MKPDDLKPSLYATRRARLAQAMQGGVAVVPTAPQRVRNRDTHFPYRYDSHFYYLTGFPEPEAVLV
ncbi:MAG: aminopeptidase P N-terminal domain-containing protein, partial [Burkholderiales bacterium]